MSVPNRRYPDTARLPDEQSDPSGSGQNHSDASSSARPYQLRFYARDNLQIRTAPQIDKPEGI